MEVPCRSRLERAMGGTPSVLIRADGTIRNQVTFRSIRAAAKSAQPIRRERRRSSVAPSLYETTLNRKEFPLRERKPGVFPQAPQIFILGPIS